MESSNTQTNPVAVPAQSPTHSSQTGFSHNVCTVLHCKLWNRKMKSLKRLKNSLLHNQTVRQVRKQSLNTWAGENLHHFRLGGAVVYPFWFGDAFKGTRKLFNPTGRRGWHDFTSIIHWLMRAWLTASEATFLSHLTKSRVKEKLEEEEVEYSKTTKELCLCLMQHGKTTRRNVLVEL